MIISKICKYLNDSDYRFWVNADLGFYDWMPDKIFLKKKYKSGLKKEIDLSNPNSFNEKLQWLKLYNRNPLYTVLVDKYAVKEYVSNAIGADYIIPTIGVWDNFNEIDFSELPEKFVLKCTHDSGGLVICKDKSTLNLKQAKRIIEKSLNRNYYYSGREWPYKNVQPRIIAEPYMEDQRFQELRDYKFFCFNGRAKCFKIDFDRQTNHRANYYDRNGSPLHFGEVICLPDYNKKLELPVCLELMIRLAEELSRDIPFVRVDFYEIDGHVYFGELTFFPASGFGKFEPEEWDDKLGEWLTLPDSEN